MSRLLTSPRLVVAPLAVAAVVGTAFLVTDSGGDPSDAARSGDGSPSATPTVSTQDFCDGFGELAAAQQAVLTSATPAGVRGLKDAARTVGDLAGGTSMSAQAKAGVDYVVTAISSLDDDATAQDLVASDDAATLKDDAYAEALATFLSEECRP